MFVLFCLSFPFFQCVCVRVSRPFRCTRWMGKQFFFRPCLGKRRHIGRTKYQLRATKISCYRGKGKGVLLCGKMVCSRRTKFLTCSVKSNCARQKNEGWSGRCGINVCSHHLVHGLIISWLGCVFVEREGKRNDSQTRKCDKRGGREKQKKNRKGRESGKKTGRYLPKRIFR